MPDSIETTTPDGARLLVRRLRMCLASHLREAPVCRPLLL